MVGMAHAIIMYPGMRTSQLAWYPRKRDDCMAMMYVCKRPWRELHMDCYYTRWERQARVTEPEVDLCATCVARIIRLMCEQHRRRNECQSCTEAAEQAAYELEMEKARDAYEQRQRQRRDYTA